VRKCFVYSSIILVLLALGYVLTYGGDSAENEVQLVRTYESICHPEGAEQTNYKINQKNQERWINSVYDYTIPNEEVAQYYHDELIRKGWTRVQYDVGYGNTFYAYIKGRFFLVLGPHRGDYWTVTLHYRDMHKEYEPEP